MGVPAGTPTSGLRVVVVAVTVLRPVAEGARGSAVPIADAEVAKERAGRHIRINARACRQVLSGHDVVRICEVVPAVPPSRVSNVWHGGVS
jgi:hypothetical protein